MLPADYERYLRPAAAVGLLAAMWLWESLAPARAQWPSVGARARHAAANLALALANTVMLALAFGAAVVAAATWAERNGVGLLRLFDLPGWLRLPLALVLLDGWLYLWHRANHAVPWLWRFHRLHHADERLDVTTATRFHPGELALSAVARLALVPLVGLTVADLLLFDGLVVAATQFHHANVSLGRLDAPLRRVVVTPGVHHVHHSTRPEECDSNFGVMLTLWDRLAGTLRHRPSAEVTFGLPRRLPPAPPSARCPRAVNESKRAHVHQL